jgi:hypothetical protein
VREAANRLVATEVAVSYPGAQLMPPYPSVQAAIEGLWLQRQAGALRVIASVADLQAALALLQPGLPLALHFTPGLFVLPQPLLLRGLTDVSLIGAGPGTRLQYAGEAVLLVQDCASLTLRGFALEALGSTEGGGLQGALTVTDTPEVCIEQLHADSAHHAGARLAAATLTVNNATLAARRDAPASRVRISGCTLRVGRHQAGILCIDVDRSLLRDNLLLARPAPAARAPSAAERARVAIDAQMAALLAKGQRVSAERFRGLVGEQIARLGLSGLGAGERAEIDAEVQDAYARYRDAGSGGRLRGLLGNGLLRGLDLERVGRLQLLDELQMAKAERALAAASAQQPTVQQRGIVVAGQRTAEVHIVGNQVLDVVEGITVALSRNEHPPIGAPLHAGRVVITDNTLRLHLPLPDAQRNRFGIAVGHADSVRIEGNRIQRPQSGNGHAASVEGVRLIGEYGPHLSVRDNHLQGVSTGVHLAPQQLPADLKQAAATRLWLLQGNLAEGAERVLDVQPPALLEAGVVLVQHNR